ncbi:MAG: replication protein RepA [Acidobacteria bacterium]|nr:replication protein RepA [Acidobacteriota bacterium]
MKRKRGKDEWFPIGGVFSGQDGLEQELEKVSPQAAYHFTRVDQVDQLVDASEGDPDMGFMARLMTLCSLPRTNPGNRLQYVRRNGPYALVMIAGGLNKLPYGNLPRLLLAWVCTEAVKTQSRELVLGRSLSEFMRKLGLAPVGGGTSGARTRLRNQMDRLFNAHVSLIYEDKHGKATVNSQIADRTELWWNPRHPDAPTLWDSKIELGEKFFNEIIGHPVPLNMNILKALKRSSLGLDLYLWLTYRTFSLKHARQLPWKRLYRQFGADPAKANERVTVDNFRKDCLRELIKIKTAWPGLSYSTAKGVLILSPSKPAIAPAKLQLVK